MGEVEQRSDGVGRRRRMTGPDRGLMCGTAETLDRGGQPDRQSRAPGGGRDEEGEHRERSYTNGQSPRRPAAPAGKDTPASYGGADTAARGRADMASGGHAGSSPNGPLSSAHPFSPLGRA